MLMIYACRIPTFLKLNSVALYFQLVQQVLYVYCECHIIMKFRLLLPLFIPTAAALSTGLTTLSSEQKKFRATLERPSIHNGSPSLCMAAYMVLSSAICSSSFLPVRLLLEGLSVMSFFLNGDVFLAHKMQMGCDLSELHVI